MSGWLNDKNLNLNKRRKMKEYTLEEFKKLTFQEVIDICHQRSVAGGWWHDAETGEMKERNKGEMLCLIHSEVSEMMEGERKGINDDHLPHRSMAEVEGADVAIRLGDYMVGHGYDVVSAIYEKLEYNKTRADHNLLNRAKTGGKKF